MPDYDNDKSEDENEEDEEGYACTACSRDVKEGEYIKLPDSDDENNNFVFCKSCVDKAYPRKKGASEPILEIPKEIRKVMGCSEPIL